MMSDTRVGVVGVGYLGRFHAQKWKSLANCRLVGVADQRFEQAQTVATELSVQAFQNPRDMIGQVDAVTIAASTQSHFELAKLFIENGIHVNVEKPITATYQQALDLKNVADKNPQVKIAVGHIERFNPVLVELKNQAKNIRHAQLVRWATFKERGADVSVVHDLMIHDIDILFWLFAEKPKNMWSTGRKFLTNELDYVETHFEFASGKTASINVNRTAAEMIRRVDVHTDTHFWSARTGANELEFVERTGDRQFKSEKKIFDKSDALLIESKAFLDWIRGGHASVGLKEGMEALECAENICAYLAKSGGL